MYFISFAFVFRCSERHVVICKMTTLSQLETLQKEIDRLEAKILKTEEALAATQSTTQIDILQKQLERLHRERIVRCEQETVLLQRHKSGEHCLPRYLSLVRVG